MIMTSYKSFVTNNSAKTTLFVISLKTYNCRLGEWALILLEYQYFFKIGLLIQSQVPAISTLKFILQNVILDISDSQVKLSISASNYLIFVEHKYLFLYSLQRVAFLISSHILIFTNSNILFGAFKTSVVLLRGWYISTDH